MLVPRALKNSQLTCGETQGIQETGYAQATPLWNGMADRAGRALRDGGLVLDLSPICREQQQCG